MPKFSAYMKGGDGSVGPPGASIIDGILPDESYLPVPNHDKYAFLVGTSDPKHFWVWNEEKEGENKWEDQGTTASQIGKVSASVTTIPWSTTAVPLIQTQFSTDNQIDYFNFDFTLPEGQPAGFGIASITTEQLSYTSQPTASISTSGNNWEKNFHFKLGIPEGIPAGFSTNQLTTVTTLAWDSPATVEIIPDDDTPNDDKSFLFSFGIPQGRAAGFSTFSASITTLSWTNDPIININESGPNYSKNIDFNFQIPNARPAGFSTSQDATAITTAWNDTPTVEVSTTDEDWQKKFHFDFKIPVGRPAGFGEIHVTTESVPSGSEPWVSITTVNESPEHAKEFEFNFGIPQGVAAGFSTVQHVSVSTLDSGEEATVEITTVTTSPETSKEFNFHFGLPRGDALAIYDGIPFTTENGTDYYWVENNGTTTLVFNRGTVEKLPIYIYNNDNESIAATFKLSTTTIEYEADEKFNGTMYLMMPATLQSVEVGNVSSADYGINPSVSMSTGSTSTKIILDFVIPEGYPGHTTIDSITTNINSLSTNINNLFTDIDSITTNINNLFTDIDSITTNINSLFTDIDSITTNINSLSTAIHGKALHISMPSTSSLGTISNSDITTTMRVVNIVWGTPSNVTSNVSWNTNTAGQLVLSGTLSGATTAEIDLVDFG